MGNLNSYTDVLKKSSREFREHMEKGESVENEHYFNWSEEGLYLDDKYIPAESSLTGNNYFFAHLRDGIEDFKKAINNLYLKNPYSKAKVLSYAIDENMISFYLISNGDIHCYYLYRDEID